MSQYNFYKNKSPFTGIIALVGFVLFFVMLFFLAKGIFTILSWLAIPLIILAVILDYSVVVNYGKYVLGLIQKKPIAGILLAAFTIVGFPLVAGFLATRAYLGKKLGSLHKEFEEKQETFTEFEEIEEEVLDLPEIETKTPKANPEVASNNDYDILFED